MWKAESDIDLITYAKREVKKDDSYGEKFKEPYQKEKHYEENYRDIYEEQKKKSDEDFYWEGVQEDLFFSEKNF